MASNAKNIAELLNNQTTIATADLADDAVTADKIADAVALGAGYYYTNAGTATGNTSAGKNSIIRVNNKTITGNTTIGATENASCTGPITVNSGVTLTVTSGGRFVAL